MPETPAATLEGAGNFRRGSKSEGRLDRATLSVPGEPRPLPMIPPHRPKRQARAGIARERLPIYQSTDKMKLTAAASDELATAPAFMRQRFSCTMGQ
jgi:hypothetical protein